MNTIETMLSHRSVRKFKNQPIEESMLQQILKAACSGSTMGNMQLYSIIVTQDKEMMQKMAPFHFNQPIATNAPLMLTFCVDINRFYRYCEARDVVTDAYSNMHCYHWAITDTIIAAQNACVAAESLGLGLCFLGTIIFNTPDFIDVLNLPKHVIPLACVAIGYPDENMPLTDKLPVEALIHTNTYQDYSDERINELYKEKEAHPNTIALLKENNMENLAQVFTQRFKKEDNEYFASLMIQSLVKQGFMK